MGLEENGVIPSGSIWKKARFGEHTIIGNLDTGNLEFGQLIKSQKFILTLYVEPSRQ